MEYNHFNIMFSAHFQVASPKTSDYEVDIEGDESPKQSLKLYNRTASQVTPIIETTVEETSVRETPTREPPNEATASLSIPAQPSSSSPKNNQDNQESCILSMTPTPEQSPSIKTTEAASFDELKELDGGSKKETKKAKPKKPKKTKPPSRRNSKTRRKSDAESTEDKVEEENNEDNTNEDEIDGKADENMGEDKNSECQKSTDEKVDESSANGIGVSMFYCKDMAKDESSAKPEDAQKDNAESGSKETNDLKNSQISSTGNKEWDKMIQPCYVDLTPESEKNKEFQDYLKRLNKI